MSKKKTQAKPEQPAYIEELLTKGYIVLEAKSREELSEMVDNIPANNRYGAGAVGKNKETGVYTLRIDIINH